MKIERILNYLLLTLLIVFLTFTLVNGQDEGVIPKEEADQPQKVVNPDEVVTRLDVIIIDDVNDKLIKLNDCKVHVIGKLKIVNDSFTYRKTFTEGDRYEMVIHFKPKK